MSSSPSKELLDAHLHRLTASTLAHLPSPPPDSSSSPSIALLLAHYANLNPPTVPSLSLQAFLNLSICLSVYTAPKGFDTLRSLWAIWLNSPPPSGDDDDASAGISPSVRVSEIWQALLHSIPKLNGEVLNEEMQRQVVISIHIMYAFVQLVDGSLVPDSFPSTSPPKDSHLLLPELLSDLVNIYPITSLPLQTHLKILHIVFSLLVPTEPSPLLAALASPTPSDLLPLLLSDTHASASHSSKPFRSLWSDFESLFEASADFMSRGGEGVGWSEFGMRLVALEGQRDEWEAEALRREEMEKGIIASSNSANQVGDRGQTASGVSVPSPSQETIDAAIAEVQVLLPDLSSAFITAALSHPSFQPVPSSDSTSTELIIQSALEGLSAIPSSLQTLFQTPPFTVSPYDPTAFSTSSSYPPPEEDEFLRRARERRLATQAPISFSPLRAEETPPISSAVDSSTRERILRLVAIQREEEEEEEREEKERAKGKKEAAEATVEANKAKGKKREEEREREEEDEEDRVVVRGARRGGGGSGEESGGDDEDEDDEEEAVASGVQVCPFLLVLILIVPSPSGPPFLSLSLGSSSFFFLTSYHLLTSIPRPA